MKERFIEVLIFVLLLTFIFTLTFLVLYDITYNVTSSQLRFKIFLSLGIFLIIFGFTGYITKNEPLLLMCVPGGFIEIVLSVMMYIVSKR